MHFLQKEIRNNTRINCFQIVLPPELKAKQFKATEIVQSKIAQYYGCSVHFMLQNVHDLSLRQRNNWRLLETPFH